ncbi:MAG: DNA-processing protein DprA [Oscillospiraceae bacterium]
MADDPAWTGTAGNARGAAAVRIAGGGLLRGRGGISRHRGPENAEPLEDKDLTEPRRILSECHRKSIHILTWQDAAYPARLRSIDDPPLLLYYQGTLPDIDAEPVIAMVGTRHASLYGLQQGKMLGYQMGRLGAIVASGGADGVDTVCLTGALTAGGPVIAVLGCGVDVAYPAKNRGLFEDIRYHGCLISEFPPGTPPYPDNFPVRNRILSGISVGVVVVEAPRKERRAHHSQPCARTGARCVCAARERRQPDLGGESTAFEGRRDAHF